MEVLGSRAWLLRGILTSGWLRVCFGRTTGSITSSHDSNVDAKSTFVPVQHLREDAAIEQVPHLLFRLPGDGESQQEV